ncbi:MAG: two-component sensor histidine kinase [Flavobacteriales bacterium]|nr:MAG: two-component sensor histidine kinase [Flavobacteriales bacterium]
MKKNYLSKMNIGILYAFFTAFVFGMVVYSVFLVKELRQREASRIQVFGTAMKILQNNDFDLDPNIQDLLFAVVQENDQIPVIITDENKKPLLFEGTYRNIPQEIINDKVQLQHYIEDIGETYQPFEIVISKTEKQLVFYDNSKLLNDLQYYPYVLGVFIFAYLILSLWFLKTVKKTDEGFLWAGLAKETAHQIGTPLSSMMGWIEVMKLENQNTEGVIEMSKDINRLKTISERFSKIGSTPELNDENLNQTIQQNFDYLKQRVSNKIDFRLITPRYIIKTPHNSILMSWVIENLVKNAVDAMKGEGMLKITLYEANHRVFIDFKDTGSGMTSAQARNVFDTGFSTKKRGWGLGLSLAKRVIKDYHNGDIKVAHTELGKGTTFRIKLPILSEK